MGNGSVLEVESIDMMESLSELSWREGIVVTVPRPDLELPVPLLGHPDELLFSCCWL